MKLKKEKIFRRDNLILMVILLSLIIFLILFWARISHSVVSEHEPWEDTLASIVFILSLTISYIIPIFLSTIAGNKINIPEVRTAILANPIGVTIFFMGIFGILDFMLPLHDFIITYIMFAGALLTYTISLKYLRICFKSKEMGKFFGILFLFLISILVVFVTIWGVIYFE